MKIKEILSESPTMIFPLQQKMELLKKVAGEESIFSDQEEEYVSDEDGNPNPKFKRAIDKQAGLRLRNAISTDDIPSAE